MQTFATCLGEHPLEQPWREALLRTVEADADKGVAKRHGLLQGLERFLLGQVTQEAEDQTVADAQLFLAVEQRLLDAAQHYLEGNATVSVGLRVEERFDMDDVLRLAALQVGPGQVVEILLGAQHVGTGVIQVEKLLQVIEGIGRTQGLDIGPGQGDLVAFGQGEQQLGLQRAFQVQVQFGLGQGVQPFGHGRFSLSGFVMGKV